MKRWIAGLVLVLLSCVPILLQRSTSPGLLKDTDTAFLLLKIRERQDPLSWFTSDWPLGNHFYRPVSTLAFELDNFLYDSNAAGYGLTNALLAIACILLLFWFLRELTDNLLVATVSALLFSFWHLGWGMFPMQICLVVSVVAVVVGLVRHGLKVGFWLPCALVWFFVASESMGMARLYDGVIKWLPGRTATVMTLFALLSVAAYARYERLSAAQTKTDPTPLDPPATKGTTQTELRPKRAWVWALLSVVSLLASLASYEQAVMVPALLLGVAVSFKLRGYSVRWAWQTLFWACLVVYLIVWRVLIPSGVSDYQLQALRSGSGVWIDLAKYFLPALFAIPSLMVSFSSGPLVLLLSHTWLQLAGFASNFAALWEARRRWRLVLTGWALSFLAFMPMAWLHPFDHYHYLPMAIRSLFVVAMAWVGLDLLVIAASRPVLQAPPRPSPAPGSLLRR